MPTIFTKALGLLIGDDQPSIQLKMPKIGKNPLKKLTERELIQLESDIGKNIFGPIAEGHRREFFNLDPKTWIWYEEFTDASGIKKSTTTRYEVQEKAILKAQDGAKYSYLEGAELQNFGVAIQMYYEQVTRGVYKRDPNTGQKLAE